MQSKSKFDVSSVDVWLVEDCWIFGAEDGEPRILVDDEFVPVFNPNKSNAAEFCDVEGNWAFTDVFAVAEEFSFALKLNIILCS